MKIKTALVILLCLGIQCFSMAQTKAEKEQIEQVLNTYFDGWATGDTIKLSKAMHISCQLKTYRDGTFNEVDRSKYLSYFKPRPREKDVQTRIEKIDFTGNVANAKTRITTAKYIFTDYLNLVKTDQGWVIVDKVAYRFDK